MCGRFVATAPAAVIAAYLRVDEVRAEALSPNWNVAPTDPVAAVAERRDGHRLLGSYRWGLVPSWADDPAIGARMINARAETVASKFRAAFERRRCVVPADGFYEWERRPGPGSKVVRQPWFVRRVDEAPMLFAGLWELWWPPGADREADDPLRSCTIITTDANGLLRPIHDRMPVILAPADVDRWLDRALTDGDALRPLLAPFDDRALERFEVSTRVNSVRNNDGDLVAPMNPS